MLKTRIPLSCPAPSLDEATLLLSDREAARWLGISRATLWRRVKDGTLPAPIRIGGATRFRRDKLLTAVEQAEEIR